MVSTKSHPALCIGSELLLALGILVAEGRALAETFVWHSVPSGVTATLTSVAWANDRFLAVGAGGTILSSTNGLVWKSEVSGLGVTFEAAGFAGGKYYVVGGQGTILASVDAILLIFIYRGISPKRKS